MSYLGEVYHADELLALATEECLYGATSSVSEPRGMKTYEALSLSAVITDPTSVLTHSSARGWKPHYAAANLCLQLARSESVDEYCFWNEEGRRVTDDGRTLHGANYGKRWVHGGLASAIALLKKDRETRRAWVAIWDQSWEYGPTYTKGFETPRYEGGYSAVGKDVPCTIGFGLRINYGELDMQVVMRSQSVVGVMPYDVFLFGCLQQLIANELGVKLGTLHWHMLSAHVYERELEKAQAIVELWHNGGEQVKGPHSIELDMTLTEATKQLPMLEDALRCGAPVEPNYSIELYGMMEFHAREARSAQMQGVH